MKEKTLLIIAVICVLAGIPIVYFASQNIFEDEFSSLKLEGIVDEVRIKDEVTIVKVEARIPVVMFEKVELEKGSSVAFKGRLSEYKNNLEFIAEEVIFEK